MGEVIFDFLHLGLGIKWRVMMNENEARNLVRN